MDNLPTKLPNYAPADPLIFDPFDGEPTQFQILN